MNKLFSRTCIILVFCFLLSGCSNSNGEPVEEINADASLSYSDPTELSKYPNYVRKQCNDSLYYDMDVIVPTPEQFNTYTATMRIPDEDLWLNTFFPDSSKSDFIEENISDSTEVKNTSYKTGNQEFTISREQVIYKADTQEGYGGVYEYLAYATGIKYPSLSSLCSNETVELDSIKKQDTINLANEFIQKLELPVDDSPTVYTFTQSQMRKVAAFSNHGKGVEEGYFLLYHSSVDGVPIFTDYHMAPLIEAPCKSYGSSIGIIITKDGIRNWNSYSFYDTEIVEQNVNIVPLNDVLDDAVTRLQSKYEGNSCLINHAELCYLPVAEKP